MKSKTPTAISEELSAIGRELHSIAKMGLTYSRDPYDRERFESVLMQSAKLFAQVTSSSEQHIGELLNAEAGPVTPKLAVRAGIFDNAGRILLVRESADGLWSLPGGWVDVNLTPAEAARTEVMQEACCDVELDGFCGLFDQRKLYPNPLWHIICAFFIGRIKSINAFVESAEIRERGFFELGDLPPLSTKRIRLSEIKMLFEWKQGMRSTPIFE